MIEVDGSPNRNPSSLGASSARILIFLCGILLCTSIGQANSQSMPSTASPIYEHEAIVPLRLPVVLALDESAQAQSLAEGQVLSASVLQSVRSRGTTYIAAEAPGRIRVCRVVKRGFLGRPARVELEALDVLAIDGRRIALSGDWVIEGEDLTIETVSGAGAICFLAVFFRGGEVKLGKGGAFTALTRGGEVVHTPRTSNE